MKSLLIMVIYPPEEEFPEERRYASSIPYDEDAECWEGLYWHHEWQTEDLKHPEIGSLCQCGQITYQGEG